MNERLVILAVSLVLGMLSTSIPEVFGAPSMDDTAIKGEQQTMVNLVKQTEQLLQDHHLTDQNEEKEFLDIHKQLLESPPSPATIKATWNRLGQIVGRAAKRKFSKSFLIWTKDRWADISPYEWPETKTAVEPILLKVNMGEDAYRSAALIATNTRATPLHLSVKVDCPSGGPRVTLRRGWYVSCPDHQYRADALILVSDGQITIAPGQTTCIWLQLDSHGARAGLYPIRLTLSDSHAEQQAEIQTHVYGVRMPDALKCTLFNYSYVNDFSLLKGLQLQALKDLKAHYINTYIIPDSIAPAHADASGHLVDGPDFSKLDEQINTYRFYARQLGFFWGGGPEQNLGKVLFPELVFLSQPWKQAVSEWYTAYLAHLDKIGLKPDQYFMYPYDEYLGPNALPVYALLKRIAPNVRLLADPTPHSTDKDIKAMLPYVDIWMPRYSGLVDARPETMDLLKSSGKSLWTYGCVNGSPLPVYDTNLRRHWIAWKLGMTGVAYWAYADHGGWTGKNSWQWVLGAFAQIYTQAHAPEELKLTESLTPSKRWDAWREGAEDGQLLRMAQARMSTDEMRKLDQWTQPVLQDKDHSDKADHARAKILAYLAKYSH